MMARKKKIVIESTATGSEKQSNRWLHLVLLALVVVIALLHAYAAFFPSGITWGFHHLGFLSLPWKIVIPLLMLSILHPRVQTMVMKFITTIAGVTAKLSTTSKIVAGIVGLSAAGAIFWMGREATSFLGDGIFAQRSLTNIQTAENIPVALQNAPLPGFITWKVYGYLLTKSTENAAQAAFQVVSVVCGILGVGAFFFLSGALLRDRADRVEQVLVFILLLVGGSVQLFFGYVENYTVAYLVLLLFFWLSLAYISGRVPLWLPSIFFGFMFASHFGMVYLMPALLLLYFHAWKKKKVNDVLIAVGVMLVATYAVLMWCGYSPQTVEAIFMKEGGGHRVPLFEKSTGWHAYTMFSPWHFVDIKNLYILLSPFPVVFVFLLIPRYRASLNTKNIPLLFLLATALFSLAFTFGFNFDIGMSRDWDLLAPYNLGLIIAGTYAILHCVEQEVLRRKILLIAGWVTLFSTLPWILVNAQVGSSLERFNTLRDERLWGAAALIYADEDLGGYHRDRKEYSKAIEYYREGLAIDSTNSRRWLVIANSYQMNGENDRAIYALDKAVQLGTRSLQTHAQLGEMYVQRRQFDKAVAVWRKALEQDPGQAAFSYYIGATLSEHLGKPQEALAYLLQSKSAFPNAPEMLYALGSCYQALGAKEKMKTNWEKFLQVAPNHPEAAKVRNILAGKK